MKTRNKVARGGSIHPISEAPTQERFEAMFKPGADVPWEAGEWDPDVKAVFRRDGTPLFPEFFSPLPGQTIALQLL